MTEVVSAWDLSAFVKNGLLMGSAVGEEGVVYREERRLGYEQYAARGVALCGLYVAHAMAPDPHLTWSPVPGVEVPEDIRSHRRFEAITPM